MALISFTMLGSVSSDCDLLEPRRAARAFARSDRCRASCIRRRRRASRALGSRTDQVPFETPRVLYTDVFREDRRRRVGRRRLDLKSKLVDCCSFLSWLFFTAGSCACGSKPWYFELLVIYYNIYIGSSLYTYASLESI